MHKDLEHYLPFLINALSENIPGTGLEPQWISVLENFFSPARLSKSHTQISHCRLSDDKRILYIPAIEHNHGYELSSQQSTETFSDNDPVLAHALLKLSCQFISVQEAAEQGATEERQRIARDLHDDVAARLLTLIHQARDQGSIDLARSILKSLRNAIYTLDNKATTTILDALTDVRAEIQDRLNPLGMQLIWEQNEDVSGLIFTPRQHINLQRILHEVTTNMIRHAEAQYLTVTIWLSVNQFHIQCCDDGKGFDSQQIIPGKGLNNIRNRIEELNGKVVWSLNTHNNNKGSCVDIVFPVSTVTES